MTFSAEWDASFATFSPKEVSAITGITPQLLRLWRKRGYVPEKERGQWSKHTTEEVLQVYLIYAFSQLGIAPSEIYLSVNELVPDLFFFTITSADGACSFHGSEIDVSKFRRQFDGSLDVARELTSPVDESRFVVADGVSAFQRCSDISSSIESHSFEFFRCIDLVTAGMAIAARAQRPMVSFHHRTTDSTVATVRHLSHGSR